jgi:hypothetical protein
MNEKGFIIAAGPDQGVGWEQAISPVQKKGKKKLVTNNTVKKLNTLRMVKINRRIDRKVQSPSTFQNKSKEEEDW